MIRALKTARKHNAVSLKRGGDYAVIGYNDEIKYEAGARIRAYIENGWQEVQ